jgi:hypothetical protein
MIEYQVKVSKSGTEWYLNGKRHREDGPAIEWSRGCKEWWLNNQLHREDGPAIESSNGHKSWFLKDRLHREDGPAIESSNGDKSWFLNGVEVTETDVMTPVKQPIRHKPWVGLTADEIWSVYKQVDSMQYMEFSHAIEDKLKEKNT